MTNNKKDKIKKITLITISVVLVLLAICGMVVSVSAISLYSCPNCNSTDGNHSGYADNLDGTHYEMWCCNDCGMLSSKLESHYIYRTETVATGGIHESREYCECGVLISTTPVEHSYNISYTQLDSNSHSVYGVCSCGKVSSYTTVHNGYRLDVVSANADGHTVRYQCRDCDYIWTSSNTHTYNTYDICIYCDFKNPKNYKHDINFSTGSYKRTDFSALISDYYTIDDKYNTSVSILNVNGWVAVSEGVDYYYYQIATFGEPATTHQVVNKENGKELTQAIITNIDNSQLGIKNYNKNAYYNIDIPLMLYKGKNIVISVGAKSYSGQSVILAIFTGITYGEEETETESEIETETETETETNTPIIPPDEGDGNYHQGYADGYEQALRDLNGGIFSGAEMSVIYWFEYDQTPGFTPTELVVLPVQLNNGGIDLSPAWEWWKNSKYYNDPHYELWQMEFQLFLDTAFEWTNELLYFTISGSNVEKYLPYECVVRCTENGELYDLNYKANGNKFYLVNSELNGSVEFLQFYINNQNIKINDLFENRQFKIHNNLVNFTLHCDSYNKGKADGYDSGSKEGYDKGFENGKKYADSEQYNKGYEEGYDKGEDEGYAVGFIKGKGIGLKENFNWYEIPTSILDSMSNTFHKLFSFEIFGVNIASFLLSVMTMLIAGFILKKVL